jgi:hypothetical protein
MMQKEDNEDNIQAALIESAMEKLKHKFPPATDEIFDLKSTSEFCAFLQEITGLELMNSNAAAFLAQHGYKSEIIGDEVMWMIGSEII